MSKHNSNHLSTSYINPVDVDGPIGASGQFVEVDVDKVNKTDKDLKETRECNTGRRCASLSSLLIQFQLQVYV